ncbi:chemotaxis protein CheW [Roseomonas nepalensis]|uniref:Chemotaxis protein CheW n=1 Tax=Muricoccus nepalensis TaxID=1854500 RepID=A0A502GE83_9PROT|nr:chemotaxis protein CheW [Roseomonas nepalensis]TPG60429.1 chemotaxis protein CheW [Roseomonas nepalensis]
MVLRFLPDPGLLGGMDEARAERLLEERTRRLAGRGTRREAAGAPVLVVALGGELFGLPLDGVAAVLAAEPPCRLPGSPPEVLGLRARAGRIHAVLDLARLLGLPGGEGEHDVLLRPPPAGGRRLALRVGRALSALAPRPLPGPASPAPASPVAFRATLPGAGEPPVLGVIDLGRLLRPYASPLPGA